MLFAYPHHNERDAEHDHGAAGESAPAELFVQDNHAENYGYDWGHEGNQHRFRDVHVLHEPVVKQERDH